MALTCAELAAGETLYGLLSRSVENSSTKYEGFHFVQARAFNIWISRPFTFWQFFIYFFLFCCVLNNPAHLIILLGKRFNCRFCGRSDWVHSTISTLRTGLANIEHTLFFWLVLSSVNRDLYIFFLPSRVSSNSHHHVILLGNLFNHWWDDCTSGGTELHTVTCTCIHRLEPVTIWSNIKCLAIWRC